MLLSLVLASQGFLRFWITLQLAHGCPLFKLTPYASSPFFSPGSGRVRDVFEHLPHEFSFFPASRPAASWKSLQALRVECPFLYDNHVFARLVNLTYDILPRRRTIVSRYQKDQLPPPFPRLRP